MKLAMSLFLAVLAIPMTQTAQQQLTPQRVVVQSDGDDDGLLPFTLATPIGEASGLLHDGLAIFTVAGLTLGPMPSAQVPYAATVDGHLCTWHMLPAAGGIPAQLVQNPIPAAEAPSLDQAAAEYAASVAAAGPTVHACAD